MKLRQFVWLTINAALLSACGPQMAGSAAAEAALQVQQASQALATKQAIEQKLGDAVKAAEASASAAAQ